MAIRLGGWGDTYLAITQYNFQKLSSAGKKYLWIYHIPNSDPIGFYARDYGSVLLGAVNTSLKFVKQDGSLEDNHWDYPMIYNLPFSGQSDITTSGAGIIFPVDDKPAGWYAVEITDAVNSAIENSQRHLVIKQVGGGSARTADWAKKGIMSIYSYASIGITNVTDFDVRTVHCISNQNITPPTLSDYIREGKADRAYKITNAIRDAYSSYFPPLDFDSLWA
jgi:hypothetical protein